MPVPEWRWDVDRRLTKSLTTIRQGQPKSHKQILAKMSDMMTGDDPFPPDSIKLHGVPGGRRVDIGEFRILYHVDESARRVTFYIVDRRNDNAVYQQLEALRNRILQAK